MARLIKSFENLHHVEEVFESVRLGPGKMEAFLSTSFSWFDDANDLAYFGKIKKPMSEVTLQEIVYSLRRIPHNQDIFPQRGSPSGWALLRFLRKRTMVDSMPKPVTVSYSSNAQRSGVMTGT